MITFFGTAKKGKQFFLMTVHVRYKLVISVLSSFALVIIMDETKQNKTNQINQENNQNQENNKYGADTIVSGRDTAGCLHREIIKVIEKC